MTKRCWKKPNSNRYYRTYTMNYGEFLKTKQITDSPTGIDGGFRVSKSLFDFQAAIVKWSVHRGRAAIFAGTGLGKTAMQADYARIIEDALKQPVLIVAPLAVSHQTIEEAKKILGIEIKFAASQSDIGERGIYITNYQKRDHFDPAAFCAIILDESSILKNESGKTRNRIIEDWSVVPFRLCCTATPAPNDYTELGNHAEFLGVMSMQEMLATFFVHDGGETQNWRLKGHAENDFWKWLSSWAVCVNHPRDIGFDQLGYDLPELRIHEVLIDVDATPMDGELFAMPARTLNERRHARKVSVTEKMDALKKITSGLNGHSALFWAGLNSEAEQTAEAISSPNLHGGLPDETKTGLMLSFASGEISRLVSKVAICGYGMNFQVCHTMFFIGLSDSWEGMYQAIRRCWRFGQKNPVDVYIILSSMEVEVLNNIKRKESDAQRMQRQLVEHMANFTKQELKGQTRMKTTYKTGCKQGENWTAYHGDCVEGVKSLESDSIGFSVFSPPFASLYTYSASDRDMGNCRNDGEFMEHFAFLVEELLRVTQPGRLCSFHCMNMPTSKVRDGHIGIKDFRGELIRLFVEKGWIYHSEVCIWKDPVTAMQRTKALGLLHKQIVKDSCMSRQGVPDYLVTMRKPGDNQNRVEGEFDRWIGDEANDPTSKSISESYEAVNPSTGDVDIMRHHAPRKTRLSIDVWQRYASPVWMDINPSDTLQFRSAREHSDERHICPLQLQVIERAIEMWSNPGDLVLSPFMGIGSEGYVAIENGRKFVGFELKESYFKQACANLAIAEAKKKETMLL